MKKILVGAIIALASVLIYKSCSDDLDKKVILQENSMLIEQQINNVSKLIVTEGHFAEIYNYADSKELFGPLITADKKALVVVNADVTIAYDLTKVDFKIDQESRTLFIKNIPEPEVKINPDFEYYDVSADYLNQFDAKDYNAIKRNVNASLFKKIEASTLKSNSENRLLTELSKFLLLTNSMGWKLVFEDKSIGAIEELNLNGKHLIR
ncbi:DUF4230 domain-containing protein [Croceitalea rosinachiae]|uniref:DUF4230 domain-containing protein n=1 Tax=Croceitalea rosinachiae TaxID=3075596 RepID=A0ABU3A9E1_9FLAO|nr:DUF4230 domain-containing protein [Croceitalea sp. F388]MDT0606822.1 DUF4230 domain-containing protein [Croceitalea sp. F388]